MKLVTASQMRKIEQIAIEEHNIPSILLMENAALSLAKHCLAFLSGKKNPKVLIFCGSGNNGGDGMALARHLCVKGVDVQVIYCGDLTSSKGDPAVYLDIIRKLGVPVKTVLPDSAAVEAGDLVVDAMLGTGLDRNVSGKYACAIELLNCYAKHIISVDIPSGVHSDTGQIMNCAVKAAQTVTFGHPKIGLFVYPGAQCAGKISIEDISLSEMTANDANKVDARAQILTDEEAAHLLPARPQRSNKGSFGKVMIFAGSSEMPGAAALASCAAYAVGAGLVCACVLPYAARVIHNRQSEVVTRLLPGKDGMYFKKSLEAIKRDINSASVILLGPGIGRSGDVTEFVLEVLFSAQVPLVLDADALFAVSKDVSILKNLKAPCIITPHPGEMSKLTGIAVTEILENPASAAASFAKEHNVITLLKDAHTVIAHPNGSLFINTTGCSALAKAGTGDVLAGMIAGFAAQNTPTQDSLWTAGMLGAHIHGRAGEAASERLSNYSVTASDVIKFVPPVLRQLTALQY